MEEFRAVAKGFSSVVVKTGGGRCLRIARSADAARRLRYGFTMSAMLIGRLGGLELPQEIAWCPPVVDRPFGAVLSTWLDGVHVTNETNPDSVAAFIRSLRAVDPGELLPTVQSYDEWRREQIAQARRGLSAAAHLVDPAIARSVDLLIGNLADDLKAIRDPRLVHGDLWHENLLDQDGQLVAVLDWEACAIGDPAIDLAGLWCLGDAWAGEVIDAALVSPPERQRCSAWRVIRELEGAAWSAAHRDDDELNESAAKVTDVARRIGLP